MSYSTDWFNKGNSGTVFGTNFLGTIDNVSFEIRTFNQRGGWIDNNSHTSFGYGALKATTGTRNAAFGYQALILNGSGTLNTAVGWQAMLNNVTQNGNTAVGAGSLNGVLVNGGNTAVGQSALANCTQGANTAVGQVALNLNTTGYGNTGMGSSVMGSNTTGSYNVAMGQSSMNSNQSGQHNVAIGTNSSFSNVSSSNNVTVGDSAMFFNTASSQTAIGYSSFTNNTTSSDQVGLGYLTARYQLNGGNNTVIGSQAGIYQVIGNGIELATGATWTSTGWTGSGNTWTHTPGNTSSLVANITSIANQYYALTYTISGATTGSIDISFGSSISTGITINFTNTASPIRILVSGPFTITPTSDYDGTFTLTSLKESFISRISNSVILGAFAQSYNSTDTNTIIIGQAAVGRGTNTTTIGTSATTSSKLFGVLNVGTSTDYADNAAALAGGLVIGDVYRTGDFAKIVH